MAEIAKSKVSAKPTAAELVKTMRTRIMDGTYAPNQRLVEIDLVEELGASRGNIRLALAELTMEGLIDHVPNRGARVRQVSPTEAIEITEIRSVIEALCASKAAERINETQVHELQVIAQQLRDAYSSSDVEGYKKANSHLHQKLIEISGMTIAAETIFRLRAQSVRQQFQQSHLATDQAESLRQHLDIIDAVSRKDPVAAQSAMLAHLKGVAAAIGKGLLNS